MANKQTECLNIKCSTQIEEGLWCSMECKKQFLLKNFAMNTAMIAFKENDVEFKKSQKKVLDEIKESGLSFTDFMHSLGDYNEDDVSSEASE